MSKVKQTEALVIDGNNLAFRAYVKGQNAPGYPTTFLALKMLRSLCKQFNPSLYFVAWDYGKSKFRKEIFPEYKIKRKSFLAEEQFEKYIKELNILHKVVALLGIMQTRIKGIEADDIIAYFVRHCEKKCVIVSTDKDLLQLITPSTLVYRPIRGEFMTVENFEKKMKIPLKYYLDFRVLVGDVSDGIPGVSGIGEKTARKLVTQYGGAYQILNSISTLAEKSKRIARLLEPESYRIIKRNFKLMDLCKDNVGDLENAIWESDRIINKTKVRKFFTELKFYSLLKKLDDFLEPFYAVAVRHLK